MKKSILAAGFIAAFIPAAALAEGPMDGREPTAKRFGVSAAISAVPLAFGEAGPETPLSDTKYGDAFETGAGVRLEFFQDMYKNLRLGLGGVYNSFGGKRFTGGEFPKGADFEDFSFYAVYFGGRIAFDTGTRLRPYILGNLGITYMKSVDVTVGGQTRSYWGESGSDFFELGAGADFPVSDRAFIFADIRFQAFGSPKCENYPIAEATGGQSLPVSMGISFLF